MLFTLNKVLKFTYKLLLKLLKVFKEKKVPINK